VINFVRDEARETTNPSSRAIRWRIDAAAEKGRCRTSARTSAAGRARQKVRTAAARQGKLRIVPSEFDRHRRPGDGAGADRRPFASVVEIHILRIVK
jgi:hypothetical protein